MNGVMYDSSGNPMRCKCGNLATSGAMGKEAYILWCSKCTPMSKYEAKLVYRTEDGCSSPINFCTSGEAEKDS